MTYSIYKLKRSFRAPRINLLPAERMSYKAFNEGEEVEGYLYENDNPNVALPPDLQIIITKDNLYSLPLSVIEHLYDSEKEGKKLDPPKMVLEVSPKTLPNEVDPKTQTPLKNADPKTMPKEYRAELDRIKNTNVVSDVVKTSQKSANGMLIGAGLGVLSSLIWKHNILVGIIVGATGGGLIGYAMSKSNDNTMKRKIKKQ